MPAKQPYWDFIEQAFENVSIYDGEKAWLSGLRKYPEWVGDLLAVHWTMSEVENGGFRQFFLNSTGVVGPEAVKGFKRIGLLEAAKLVEKAMLYLGPVYPRDRKKRERILSGKSKTDGGEQMSIVPKLFSRKLLPEPEDRRKKPEKEPFEHLENNLFKLDKKVWRTMDVYARKQSAVHPLAQPAQKPVLPGTEKLRRSLKTKGTGQTFENASSFLAMLDAIKEQFMDEGQKATAEYREHLRELRSKAPPLRFDLLPSSDTTWQEKPEARALATKLAAQGFQSAGSFAIQPGGKAVLTGFAHPQRGIHAALTHRSDTAFVALVSRYADGRCVECTNMPVPFEPAYPSWHLRQRRVGASFDELLNNLLRVRPKDSPLPATPEDFAAKVQEDYFRYQAWDAERGGTTWKELRERSKAAGQLPAREKAKAFLSAARNDAAEKALCNWWRLQADPPFPLEKVIDSLVIIHDDLTPDQVASAYWCATDDYLKLEDFPKGGAREVFAQLVKQRKAPMRKVFEKRSPLQADFYLSTREVIA
jgi:hypothetical protein